MSIWPVAGKVEPLRMTSAAAVSGPVTEIRREILQLGTIDPWRSLMAFASIVAVIAGALALFCWAPSVWTFALAFALISARQHALLILLHECWHGLYLPERKWNHGIGQVVGYLAGSKYWLAREHHLQHHRRLGFADDPDRALHSSTDKASRAALRRYFAGRVLGGQLTVSHHLAGATSGVHGPLGGETLWLVVAQLALWGLLTLLTGRWWIYPLLWALPLATLTTLLNSVRAFAEHAVPPAEEPVEPSRYFSIASPAVERFFFAPLCFHCHAEHHLFPSIPYHRLPTVRRLILDHRAAFPGYTLRPGYLAFLAGYYRALPPR